MKPAPYYITYKIFLIVACLCSGSAILKCDAQSIIGKWNRTGTKYFIADKATGKQMPAPVQMQQQMDKASAENGYKEMLEIKSNNTYTSTVSATGVKTIVHTESYALAGNKLDLNIPLVHKEKTDVTVKSVDADRMIWDLVFMGKLTEVIYTRL